MILDNDLYKFTMQQAVLHHYPDADVEYRLINRGKQTFSDCTLRSFHRKVQRYADQARLVTADRWALEQRFSFFKPWYLGFLSNFRLKSSQIHMDSQDIWVRGKWYETILWEVPLLYFLSEAYYEEQFTDWEDTGIEAAILSKGLSLDQMHATWADFGTRRRRKWTVQDWVVKNMSAMDGFVGTSNVSLALAHGVKAIGTMAHEWAMGVGALEGLRYANRWMMRRWQEVYEGNLGIALTDTYGSPAFWRDFDGVLTRQFDGVRWDSGCPFQFTDAAIQHYTNMGVDPTSKTIVYSDSLDLDMVSRIQNYQRGQIKKSYGIGTFFTNDYPDEETLNIVCKLWRVNGIPVCKRSDTSGKGSGEPQALNNAAWTFKEEYE